MPIVFIATTAMYQPASSAELDTPQQQAIARLGEALPGVFYDEGAALCMEPGAPAEGVLVNHVQFHPRASNVPDVGLFVLFVETGMDQEQKDQVRTTLREVIEAWFADESMEMPSNLSVDCYWAPSVGFLSMGGIMFEW